MAVKLVIGSTPAMPGSILDSARTLTVNIILEMGYVVTGSTHYASLFATGIILFIFIMLLNGVVTILSRKRVRL